MKIIMGKFNQSIGSEQITFQKVKDCYKTLPIGIHEVFKPEIGWYEPSYDWKGKSENDMANDVWNLAMSGVEHFNFEVMNEYDTIVYPDFSLNELVK